MFTIRLLKIPLRAVPSVGAAGPNIDVYQSLVDIKCICDFCVEMCVYFSLIVNNIFPIATNSYTPSCIYE